MPAYVAVKKQFFPTLVVYKMLLCSIHRLLKFLNKLSLIDFMIAICQQFGMFRAVI